MEAALAISDAYGDEEGSRRSVCRRRLIASGSTGIFGWVVPSQKNENEALRDVWHRPGTYTARPMIG